jgi:hypothetical protein
MSKKQKRRATTTTRGSSSIGISSPDAPSSVTGASFSSRTSSAEFNPDYSYVRSDLKRIFTLAALFITFLVVLSFFLR